MFVYLTLLEDCLIVSVRPRGNGVVGDAAHELQVIGPQDKFHEIDYERLRQLGDGEHEIEVA